MIAVDLFHQVLANLIGRLGSTSASGTMFQAADPVAHRQRLIRSRNERPALSALLPFIIEVHDQGEHPVLLVQRGIGVDFVEGVLVQEIFAHGACRFQLEAVDGRERVLADQADDFFQLGFFLQQADGVAAQFAPVRRDVVDSSSASILSA